jgi:multiple sugar transport system ATP-binding protein
MTAPALELDAVSKIYGVGGAKPIRAVDRVSMTVREGEIVALLGSSGCGKTSTLRMIAGFEAVTEGAVRIKGRPVHMLPPAARGVAMAFEGYSLYPPLTVRENIAFALKSARLPRAELDHRVSEIAHLLEIEPILDRYPASISGGQQQRASLGRALIRQADLHLLDEPMGQLEPQLRALLRGRIKHFIKSRGLTAILVTHDQTEANALADRIAVMEGGVLQQFAAPETLKARPANLFTGTFIGEPPMNVFEAEAGMTGEVVRLTLPQGVTLDFPAATFAPAARDAILSRRRVALGIRPHAVRLTDGGAPAVVAAAQWLGDQSHVAADFAGGTLVTVAHSRVAYRRGDRIGVAFDAADLHLFDPDGGRAIVHGGEAA